MQLKFMKQLFLSYNFKFIQFYKISKAILCGLLFFFIFINSASANSDFYLNEQWLKFMRYEKGIFGFTSQVDNSGYFLAGDGRENPKSELEASIGAFENNNFNQDHAICKFPGRYRLLLKNKLVKNEINLNKCEEFAKYREKINLQSISIIFSSLYINKPASAFGHTLLKLNAKGDGLKSDLQSYAVDYSAKVTTSNPLLYGIFGIVGGFYGRFSLMPYFLKMREYNDYESRDLWELELNLNSEEMELLIAHLWDMNMALFHYYYFTENCSYHILKVVDAIKPEWKLSEGMSYYVAPVDTLVPFMRDKSIIKNYYYRPSAVGKMQKRLDHLNSKQQAIVSDLVDSKNTRDLKVSDDVSKVAILDATIDFVDYRYPNEIHLSKDNSIQDFKHDLLTARSKINLPSQKIETKERKEKFNIGHYPRMTSFTYDAASLHRHKIMHRSALHNVVEPNGDIYANFSLEMNKSEFYYHEKLKRIILDRYDFAHVLALRPLSLLEKKISWEFSVGVDNSDQKVTHLAPFVELGIGYSFRTFIGIFYYMLFIDANQIFTESTMQDYRGGHYLGYVFNKDNIGLQIKYKKLRDLNNHSSFTEQIESKLYYSLDMANTIFIQTNKNDRFDEYLVGYGLRY